MNFSWRQQQGSRRGSRQDETRETEGYRQEQEKKEDNSGLFH